MKVFVSQPMRGKDNDEILKERDRLTELVKANYPKEEIEIIDSFFMNAPIDANPLWYLGNSIQLLSTADLAVFCKGFDCARGCMIEYECALAYGIKCLLEDEQIGESL